MGTDESRHEETGDEMPELDEIFIHRYARDVAGTLRRRLAAGRVTPDWVDYWRGDGCWQAGRLR